jgi:uncharacterized protein YbjT (DUF2867 family)
MRFVQPWAAEGIELMKVILFGATGMVGQGVLRECLLDPQVEEVLSIGRSTTGQTNAKLRELVPPDLFDFEAIEAELRGFGACFFCLGVSSTGMKEPEYRRVAFDIPLAAGKTLARLNPEMTFIYVSGAGTDGTGSGRSMWARVKGQAENALSELPFKAVMFRPGVIVPLHGIKSKTRLYRVLYVVFAPVGWALLALSPRLATTTEKVGRAMLRVAKEGAPKRVLETEDINALSSKS